MLQRVRSASVVVADAPVASIGPGLLVFIAVLRGDDAAVSERLAERILRYRLFPDASGRMACDVLATGGALLVVPQFTLGADTRRGRRPDFSPCAPPAEALSLCGHFTQRLAAAGSRVAAGRFGADMQVASINDGPVSVLLDCSPMR